jgi:hypothetical protein
MGNKGSPKSPEIQSLNDDVLANLSIEELEERLELQILHLAEAQACYDCGNNCGVNCGTNCGECTTNTCNPLCGTDCSTNCGADCSNDGPSCPSLQIEV